MSTASLEGQNLTLNKLVVNNYSYADASGYVPNQTIISSSKNGTSLQVGGNIEATGSLIADNGIVQVGSTTGNPILLSNLGSNLLSIGSSVNVGAGLTSTGNFTVNSGSIQVGATSGNPIQLTNLGSNKLGINSSVQASAYFIVSGANSGYLSVNSSNQLLWNGVVIS